MKVYFLSFVLILTNCNASQDEQPVTYDYKDAIQLAVGNFWVFQVIRTDNETGKITNKEDELIEIVDLFRLDGEEVFQMVGPTYYWERGVIDSAGYLMDFYTREVLFSGANLGQTLYENDEFRISMTDADSIINVPAGTFKTVNYKRISKVSNESANHFYAKGVGLVKQVYYSKEAKEEHDLVQYSVKKR